MPSVAGPAPVPRDAAGTTARFTCSFQSEAVGAESAGSSTAVAASART